jgi:hypothetical protein
LLSAGMAIDSLPMTHQLVGYFTESLSAVLSSLPIRI